MAVRHVCDRCGKDLNEEAYQRGLVARVRKGLQRRWKFWAVKPTKSGFMDMWELSRESIELCQNCTKEFFKFVKPKIKQYTIKVTNAKGATNGREKRATKR